MSTMVKNVNGQHQGDAWWTEREPGWVDNRLAPWDQTYEEGGEQHTFRDQWPDPVGYPYTEGRFPGYPYNETVMHWGPMVLDGDGNEVLVPVDAASDLAFDGLQGLGADEEVLLIDGIPSHRRQMPMVRGRQTIRRSKPQPVRGQMSPQTRPPFKPSMPARGRMAGLEGPPFVYYGGSAFEPPSPPPVGAMWLPGHRLAFKSTGDRGTVFCVNPPFTWADENGLENQYPTWDDPGYPWWIDPTRGPDGEYGEDLTARQFAQPIRALEPTGYAFRFQNKGTSRYLPSRGEVFPGDQGPSIAGILSTALAGLTWR